MYGVVGTSVLIVFFRYIEMSIINNQQNLPFFLIIFTYMTKHRWCYFQNRIKRKILQNLFYNFSNLICHQKKVCSNGFYPKEKMTER